MLLKSAENPPGDEQGHQLRRAPHEVGHLGGGMADHGRDAKGNWPRCAEQSAVSSTLSRRRDCCRSEIGHVSSLITCDQLQQPLPDPLRVIIVMGGHQDEIAGVQLSGAGGYDVLAGSRSTNTQQQFARQVQVDDTLAGRGRIGWQLKFQQVLADVFA